MPGRDPVAAKAFRPARPLFRHSTAAAESPDMSLEPPERILRGHGPDEAIVWRTGAATPAEEIAARAEPLPARPDAAVAHPSHWKLDYDSLQDGADRG